MRPKAKFLTVVWGKEYIERFAALALPSFLAPGNLPALAQATELEVVIMTRGGDVAFFEQHSTFRRLRAICPVRFVEIDDLIAASIYGVTLTLAYARPIIACGREMLNTHFVFMNADFVLADGSLRNLAKHIVAGRSIVLGPSFRSTAEAVEPRLESAIDAASGVLAMPPREMAALALAHPHPTTVAKTVNQAFLHSSHPNQFFWQVDERTVLGRYFLIFMLCLKPERIVTTINSYCDYAFIPEMCPSGDEVAMGDSDEFFMLELQGHDQERFMLQIGRQPEKEIASRLSEWTTAEHRRAARHDIVFHAGELPPRLETVRAEAAAFVERIGARMGNPVPHAGHRYWVGGLHWWLRSREDLGLSGWPPELGPHPKPPLLRQIAGRIRRILGRWYRSFTRTARRRLIGYAPNVTPFSPDWLDFRLLRRSLAAVLAAPGARVLVVRDEPAFIDPLLAGPASARLASLQDLLSGRLGSMLPAGGGLTHTFVYLRRKSAPDVRRVIDQSRLLMSRGGTCEVFIHNYRGESDGSNFSNELVTHVEDIVGWPPRPATFAFVGGALKRFNRRLLSRIGRDYSRFGPRALPLLLPLMAAAVPLILVCNLALGRRYPSAFFVDYCSSIVIRVAASIDGTDAERIS